MAGSLGLHALAIAAVVAGLSAHRLPVDAGAAITVFAESDPTPVAMASESSPAAVPPPEPEAVAAAEPPVVASREAPVPDFAPPPPDALAPPDFSRPPPPPPKPTPAVTRPAPPKPVPKPDSQRAAPAAASPASTEQASSAPSPAPAPAPSAPAIVAPGWNALLAAWLAANRRYPDAARRRSEEGEVTVRFTVAGDGRVSEVALAKGSGFASLDAAALRLLQGATVPAPGAEATRTVRIRFRLND